MSTTHIHLLLNHLPILGSAFGVALLLLTFLLRAPDGRRWLTRVALGTLVLAAVAAVPVNLTGEGTEHEVLHQPGVSHDAIEEHEEAADSALLALSAAGALALLTLLFERQDHRLTRPAVLTTLAVGLISAALMARTGYEGGKIRRPDLRGSEIEATEKH